MIITRQYTINKPQKRLAQVSLEMVLALVVFSLLTIGTVRVFVWLNENMAARQEAFEQSRLGTAYLNFKIQRWLWPNEVSYYQSHPYDFFGSQKTFVQSNYGAGSYKIQDGTYLDLYEFSYYSIEKATDSLKNETEQRLNITPTLYILHVLPDISFYQPSRLHIFDKEQQPSPSSPPSSSSSPVLQITTEMRCAGLCGCNDPFRVFGGNRAFAESNYQLVGSRPHDCTLMQCLDNVCCTHCCSCTYTLIFQSRDNATNELISATQQALGITPTVIGTN